MDSFCDVRRNGVCAKWDSRSRPRFRVEWGRASELASGGEEESQGGHDHDREGEPAKEREGA
jgi:hypothetical protein